MNQPQPIIYHTDNGVRRGLQVKEGRKFLHLVLLDYPLVIKRVPTSESRYIKPGDFTVPRVRRSLRELNKQAGGSTRDLSKDLRRVLR